METPSCPHMDYLHHDKCYKFLICIFVVSHRCGYKIRHLPICWIIIVWCIHPVYMKVSRYRIQFSIYNFDFLTVVSYILVSTVLTLCVSTLLTLTGVYYFLLSTTTIHRREYMNIWIYMVYVMIFGMDVFEYTHRGFHGT